MLELETPCRALRVTVGRWPSALRELFISEDALLDTVPAGVTRQQVYGVDAIDAAAVAKKLV